MSDTSKTFPCPIQPKTPIRLQSDGTVIMQRCEWMSLQSLEDHLLETFPVCLNRGDLIAAAATAAQNPKNQSMLDWAIRVQPQIPFILDSMGVKWDHIHPVMGWINRIVYCGQNEYISLEMDFRKEVETVKEMVEVFTLHQKLATLSDSEEQLNIRDEIRAYLLTLLGGGDANPETFKQIRSRIETASR